MTDRSDLLPAERDEQTRLHEVGVADDIDFRAMAVVANVFRVAMAAKERLERNVLVQERLSFRAFNVLWVLWVWGEMDAQRLAADTNIAKGTLTGVVTTLERRDLVIRQRDRFDRRRVFVGCTDAGEALMRDLFTRFNAEERRMVSGLTDDQSDDLAKLLRGVLGSMEVTNVRTA